MKFTIIVKFVFLFIFLSSVSLASAEIYTYSHNNSNFMQYSFSGDLLVPFSNYDSVNDCARLMNIDRLSNENESFNINIIDGDCRDLFLFNILNYIIKNKKNITIIYESSDLAEIKAISNFSSLINIPAFYSGSIVLSQNKIYVGHSKNIIKTLNNYPFSSGIIYVNDTNNKGYVTITGVNTNETINSINLLAGFYSKNFLQGGCVMFTGCELPKKISFKDVVDDSIKWRKGIVNLKSLVREISDWINS